MDSFKQNISNLYQERGEAWLDKLPQITKLIANKWGLTNLEPVSNLSY